MARKILAFNTSTETCSVALSVDDVITSYYGIASYRHEKEILVIIDRVLLELNITLNSLDFLVVCRGPGSFMGVRTGVCVAQGLALGADLPLVEVSSLEVLAQGIWRLTQSSQVLTTINARLGELYSACFCRHSENIWLGSKECLVNPEDLFTLISQLDGKWALVGTGWDRYPILSSNNIIHVNIRKVLFPDAQDMLPLGIRDWEKGNSITANEVQPVYLYGKTIWKKKKQ